MSYQPGQNADKQRLVHQINTKGTWAFIGLVGTLYSTLPILWSSPPPSPPPPSPTSPPSPPLKEGTQPGCLQAQSFPFLSWTGFLLKSWTCFHNQIWIKDDKSVTGMISKSLRVRSGNFGGIPGERTNYVRQIVQIRVTLSKLWQEFQLNHGTCKSVRATLVGNLTNFCTNCVARVSKCQI